MRSILLLGILLSTSLLAFAQLEKAISEIDKCRDQMYLLAKKNRLDSIAYFYSQDATIDGYDAKIQGFDAIKKYWSGINGKGIDWTWDIQSTIGDSNIIFQTGISHLSLSYKETQQKTYSSLFSVIWKKQSDGHYKIYSDHYQFYGQFSRNIFPFEKDSIWIITPTDTIFGMLFKPKSSQTKILPAIFCLQGGGDEGIDNYYYEAELFASAGIVSLVCDKSGAGRSKGKNNWITQTFEEKVVEYSHILSWLGKQSFVDSSKIGIHGPSEGGRLALALALANPQKIKFVNAVSAPLETLKENQLFAIEQLLIKDGYDYSVISETLNLFREYFEAIKNKKIPQELVDRVNILKAKYPKLYLPINSTKLPRMPQSNDIEYVFGSDLNMINCSVYFQYGELDKIVNVKRSILKIPKRDNFQIKVYSNANHSINYPNGDTHGSYHLDKLQWIIKQINE